MARTDPPTPDEGFQAIWWPTDMTTPEMVDWCRQKHMTMQEIADRCGVSRRAVTAWAAGTEASYAHKSVLWSLAKGSRQHFVKERR